MSETGSETHDETKEEAKGSSGQPSKKRRWSPIRWITSFVLIICAIFMTWHRYADRFVPYTD